MPHDPGSSRHVDKQMKMAGLGRLIWYCTPCQKQCRDANSFKQHTLSESHVRRIDNIDDVKGTINEFSKQFQSDFLNLLRTSHHEKSVHSNRFYQTYISDKNHIHLNSSKWNSLTDFVTHLGREGLCRVEEKEDGLFITYVDRSPEALRRADALKKKEQAEAADQSRDEDIIKAQIKRAQAMSKAAPKEPTPTPQPLPVQAGPISFQISAGPKKEAPKGAASTGAKPNVFKAAKKNAFQQAAKRKHSEPTSQEESQPKRR